MDFKSLVSKISSMDTPIELPKSPEQPKPVQLNEDEQLRVLAGTSTILEEAKKMKKDEPVKEDDMKVGDSKKTAKGGTVTKTKTGIVHKAGPGNYGGSDDKDTDPDADDDAPKSKKAKKAEDDKKKKEAKKKKMEEAAKPDFLDLDKDGNKKEPMKSAAKSKGGDKKDSGKKGMSDKQAKYFGKKNESVKASKKVVAESVEQQLTFKDMVRLVQESGGQQQIDAVDTVLFNWAQRVAKSKLGEGMKADLYAGLIYERNGGRFEMYDVLAEQAK